MSTDSRKVDSLHVIMAHGCVEVKHYTLTSAIIGKWSSHFDRFTSDEEPLMSIIYQDW